MGAQRWACVALLHTNALWVMTLTPCWLCSSRLVAAAALCCSSGLRSHLRDLWSWPPDLRRRAGRREDHQPRHGGVAFPGVRGERAAHAAAQEDERARLHRKRRRTAQHDHQNMVSGTPHCITHWQLWLRAGKFAPRHAHTCALFSPLPLARRRLDQTDAEGNPMLARALKVFSPKFPAVPVSGL